ncbi:response regulator transcription factor [Aestuariicoccus sp. MJ-SS9]|uniref:response regulator transcription factor n=1 Tax=Aestuariicoccus sp. MJ-SS9 TaxID=3079855 RepID=UPI0029085CC3|nr:response regulator transcription factor [Aestuariicoccus sp. MJ-SS9]MDU8912451.1 response regulator transcription factor [Aestuariicoccus sp. MJ-SS9]
MKRPTVLIVDDDPKIRGLLRNVLETEGFKTLEAATGKEAMAEVQKGTPALVTLDIRLGPDNGLEIAREIRSVSSVPVIMVTGQDDVIDRVVGLEIGADDYITKPFHVREVVARVRSVLRRSAQEGQAAASRVVLAEETAKAAKRCLRFDAMTADLDRMELRDRDGTDCGLTSGDFRLLTVFLEHPMRALSRDQLMDLTGGTEWSPLDRTIDNQVARLRKKIERDPGEPRLIKTIRGVGYKFTAEIEVMDPAHCSSMV